MRRKMFILALLMFIFAFQFSTSGGLAFFTRAYKHVFDDGSAVKWVVDWGRYLNVLLGWWVVWAPIILLALYCGIKQPRTACKIKSPIPFMIGLLLLAPFFIIMLLGQIQFVTTGVIVNMAAEPIGMYVHPIEAWEISFCEWLVGMFLAFHALCWFIGTTFIYASMAQAIRVIEEPEKQKRIYCRHCGTENKVEAIFCKDCGKKLRD